MSKATLVEQTAVTTPGAAQVSLYVDATTKRLASHDDAGTVTHYSDGTLTSDAQHGARGGGTQHAAATSGSPGFLQPADYDKLQMLLATPKALGNLGATPTLDFGAPPASFNAFGTLTANATITLAAPPYVGHYQVRLLTGVGGFTVDFATSIGWYGGVAYSATPSGSQEDLVNLFWTGSEWRGQFRSSILTTP